jgi:HK97 family phage major capsid protein
VLTDVGVLLAAVQSGSDAAFYLVMSSTTAKQIASLPSTTGTPAFPTMNPRGGTLQSIPVLVSDQLDDEVLLVDASQFAAVSAGMNIDVARHATVQMNGGNPVDLWSNNLRALRCERWWNALPLRSAAVAAVNGANYVPGSPS